jgi:hypothetical protein
MAVVVDNAGGDHESVGIQNSLRLSIDFANDGDPAVLNGDVTAKSRQSRTVNNRAAANDQIECHRVPSLLSVRR